MANRYQNSKCDLPYVEYARETYFAPVNSVYINGTPIKISEINEWFFLQIFIGFWMFLPYRDIHRAWFRSLNPATPFLDGTYATEAICAHTSH